MKVRHVDWHADEFLEGVSRLTPNEGWVYTIIINLIYSRGGAIDDDDQWISRRCNMHWRTYKAARDRLIVLDKIASEGGQIAVKRCSSELQNAFNRSSQAVQNGRKGGRPRKENNDIAKPTGFQTEKLTTNHQPPTIEERDDANASSDTRSAKPDGRSSKRGTRLPVDWQPSLEDCEFAGSLGLIAADVVPEFRDYWCPLPGSKALKLDWSATFRNRCREIANRGRGNGHRRPASAGSGDSSILAALSRVRLDCDSSGFH